MKPIAKKTQHILVFQQNDGGEGKIKGIQTQHPELFLLERFNINFPLPAVIDDSAEYLPDKLDCDLVLDFLKHPELSYDLAILCEKENIPLVASGKKFSATTTYNPVTCCSLVKNKNLGIYAEKFGIPEFDISTDNGIISNFRVLKGAPCGATCQVAQKLLGLTTDEARAKIGIEVQYLCQAASTFDPVHEKSPIHQAAKIHLNALNRAI